MLITHPELVKTFEEGKAVLLGATARRLENGVENKAIRDPVPR